MKSLWKDSEAKKFGTDPLALRVYTSQLLGRAPDLVLHGGGNTSVKAKVTDAFGDESDILYIKGSGWDLKTIQAAGFAPVKLDVLKRMAELPELTDPDMVTLQRAAMLNPSAPNPSVEAIMHAILPFTFVDHTHADAVVTITNTDKGDQKIREIYGERVLIVPYVMPGFILAKKIHEMIQGVDWSKLEGIVLMNHGIFSFGETAKESYERMIQLVTEAEQYLEKKAVVKAGAAKSKLEDLNKLAQIRKSVSKARGAAMLAQLDSGKVALAYSNRSDVTEISSRGPMTPDHIIRTKRIPLMIEETPTRDVELFTSNYQKYFNDLTDGSLTCLDPAPRWAIWPKHGILSFGRSLKEVGIISDIKDHTIQAISQAEALGGWKALPEKDLFEVEYWVLEQAKLKKSKSEKPLQGKIVLVTGAASGIGLACAEMLSEQGAAVMALDINPDIERRFESPQIFGQVCDMTDVEQIESSVEETIRRFGGLDIVISNAGNFPPSTKISDMDSATWEQSLNLNLTSHQRLLTACVPYLQVGIDPAVLIIGSKNVPAPGPGASAYSAAKAGLTQLARVAALELGDHGIRVNVIHPNQVFDTAIWSPEVLSNRAKEYNLSVQDYKTKNLLRTEITSKDVAALACTMVGPVFSKTTGAQIPIDGGNERVV